MSPLGNNNDNTEKAKENYPAQPMYYCPLCSYSMPMRGEFYDSDEYDDLDDYDDLYDYDDLDDYDDLYDYDDPLFDEIRDRRRRRRRFRRRRRRPFFFPRRFFRPMRRYHDDWDWY